MKKKFLIGNWKMNFLPGDTIAFFETYIPKLKSYLNEVKEKYGKENIENARNNIETTFCIPYINMFYGNLYVQEEKNIDIGAQNVFHKKSGAYTGEISPVMLSSIDIKKVIVGHSERRARGEKIEEITEKVKALLEENITPILCIRRKLKRKRKWKNKNCFIKTN